MSKHSSYTIKKKILQVITEKSATYAQLERKVNTGYRTIKANCEELQAFHQVSITTQRHPANNKLSHRVIITEHGLKNAGK